MTIRYKHFTSNELVQFFIITSFINNVIGILNLFFLVPAWLLYMSAGEIIASVAYILTFILFDTIIIFLILVIIGAIWPWKTAHQRAIFISTIIFIHLLLGMIILRSLLAFEYPYAIIIAISTIVMYIFIFHKYRTIKIATFVLSVANKVIILTTLYVLLDIVGVVIVVFRNI